MSNNYSAGPDAPAGSEGTLVLIRGLPGSGGKQIANMVGAECTYSAEDYMGPEFNSEKLKDCHAECFGQTREALRCGEHSIVAVCNTFTKRWEMESYLDLAAEFNWDVIILVSESQLEATEVPASTIQRMKVRWQNCHGNKWVREPKPEPRPRRHPPVTQVAVDSTPSA